MLRVARDARVARKERAVREKLYLFTCGQGCTCGNRGKCVERIDAHVVSEASVARIALKMKTRRVADVWQTCL